MRAEPLWHRAVHDLYHKALWKMSDIARAFGVDHAEVWWIVHKDLRRDHDRDMYRVIRADPERWARRVASQRKYYEKKRSDPEWRAKRSAMSAENRRQRRIQRQLECG